MKIYISGPITGTRDARERFEAMARRVKKYGHTPINPYYLGLALPDGGHTQYMALCFVLMDFADAILMMDGWDRSRGAIMERKRACAHGLPVFEGPGDLRDYKGVR